MAFPTWDEISKGLAAVGTAANAISTAANSLKKSSTTPTVTSAPGNMQTVQTSRGDSSAIFALLGIGALFLLKR